MDTRAIIGVYLAQTFIKLYKTKSDIGKLFTDSLVTELNYFQLLNDTIKNPRAVNIDGGSEGFPVFYCHSSGDRMDVSELSLEELLINAFLLQSGWQEMVIQIRDDLGRFPYKESLQYKFQFNLVPVVNFIYKEISSRINASGDSCIPFKFSGSGSNVIFSHDIDRLYSGWYESTGNLVKKPGLGKIVPWLKISYAKFFKGTDNYEAGFDLLLRLLSKWGIKSIFFLLAEQSKNDADYSLNDRFIRRAIEKLDTADHLIGIHSGFFTFQNEVLLKKQLKVVELAFGRKIVYNRQHFLKFDVNKTPEILANAGIEFDYSLGFAESACLRNSICTPFYSFDFRNFRSSDLVEIPLLFMDGTYSHYLKIREEQMIDPLEKFFSYTDGLYFNISVLFHNTAFTEFKYKGLTRLFENMATLCKVHHVSTDAHIAWPMHLSTT